jgi:exopolysaccharide biosynthesis polyprenyl glycosylphosphotransferase
MRRDLRAWITLVSVVLDALLISAAFRIAYWMRYDLQLFRSVDPANNVPYRVYLPMVVLLTVVLLLVMRREGAYNSSPPRSFFDEFYAIINATTTAIMLLIVIVFFTSGFFYSRMIFLYAGLLMICLLTLLRMVRGLVLTRLRQAGIGVDRVLIVGAGEVGRTVMRNLMAQPELGYRVIGFMDDDEEKGTVDIGPFKGLGALENLERVIREEGIDQVIIALPWQSHRKITRLMTVCDRSGVRSRVVPDLFQLSLGGIDVEAINGIPLISVKQTSLTGLNLAVKRAFDLVLTGAGTVLLAPVLLATAVAIRLDTPGPILFKQERAGRGGNSFLLYKFRSMHENAELLQDKLQERNEASGPLFKIKDDPRRTKVGRFIRQTSIDELPQLLNVLKGEMSLVGPRPGLPKEVALYQDWHRKRLEVLPGITGLWQVSGRSDLSFDEMVMLDIYYAENWSIGLDMRILLRTVPQVLFGDGAY